MPVYPISFSIPEQKLVSEVPDKTKQFADIIPGDVSTYRFETEEAYRADYQQSVFGRTQKKAGWDCLRHYEILGNGCLPWFQDLERCPVRTMTHFPKRLVLDAMRSETPTESIPELLEYTREHLTCRAMAQYVLDTVGCPSPNRILYLGDRSDPDYLRCLTAIGFKQLLGSACVDSVGLPHLYDDYPTPASLYGRGFTYSRTVPVSAKPPLVTMDEVRAGSFDLVIYGSLHRGLPHWTEVTRAYPPHRIVAFCGSDCDSHSPVHTCQEGAALSSLGLNVFIRELSSEG